MAPPRAITFASARTWPDAWLDELGSVAPESTILQSRGLEGLKLEDVEAVYGGVGRELLPRLPNLRWVQTSAAGLESVLYPEMVESHVVVTNCRGLAGMFIADLAISHFLALTTGLLAATKRPDRKTWLYSKLRGTDVAGMTAVVVGLGGIGSQIAGRCLALSMRVIGVDPIRRAAAGIELVKPDRIDDVLPLADAVFVAAPGTAARGLFDRERIGRIKRGAYVMNSSRGVIVDTDALVDALKSGHLAGAGLDVVDPEPLPPEHPLWDMPNVSITPHVGGSTDGFDQRRFRLVKENLRRYVRGLPLINVVDKRRGF